MNARAILLLSAALLVASADRASARSADSLASPDEARALANEAVRANPSIKAIEARIKGLQQRVHAAEAWADPQLSINYSNMPIDAWRPGEHPMSGIQFDLKQTFFYPGKIDLRRKVAEGQVREGRESLDERKVQLRAMVERSYYQLALVRHLRKVTGDHVKLVDQFIDVVRVKYEVGKAGQHDLVRLQVLASKLRDDLKTFDRDDRALTAEINAALHRPVGRPIRTPEQLPALDPAHTTGALSAQAETKRPLLRRLREQARTRRLAARKAAREGYPDFTASIGYRIRLGAGADPGTDFIGFGLSLPLPFWYDRRWGSQRREQEQRARAAEQQREAELDRIRGDLGRVLAGWQRAATQARAYRNKLMPLAHRALDSTFAAYQVGRADFASLFQAELQLLEYERTIRLSEAATHVHRVETEALVGKTFDAPGGR